MDFIPQAEMRELEAIRSERVGFDDLRAGFNVRLMDTKDCLRFGGIQFIEAALSADGFVQHGAHRAIGDENRVLDPFVEIENLHNKSAGK